MRTYWLAPPPAPGAPLLVVLHGTGLDGPQMAAWTGLAVRGPAAGFATVFPDAIDRIWDDTGEGRVDGADDGLFISRLIELLAAEGDAMAGAVFLAGLSNGAFFAERLARQGIVRATGLVLVSGTAREAARKATPRPQHAPAVLLFEGTKDPVMPYAGGRPAGPMAWMARRRARKSLAAAADRGVVGVETITSDWAAANGCSTTPMTDVATGRSGDLPVSRRTWTADGRPRVVLYAIEDGGHGWPGGPQFMPAFLVGRIDRRLDATGLLLEFARDQLEGL